MKHPCFACGHVAVTITPNWQECAACGFLWQPHPGRRATAEDSGNARSSKPLRVSVARLTGRARLALSPNRVFNRPGCATIPR